MNSKNVSLTEKYRDMKKTLNNNERSLLKQKMLEKTKEKLPPLSKLTESGELLCIVCNEKVKNVNIWPAHLKSEIHIKGLENLKSKLEKKPSKISNSISSDSTIEKEIASTQIQKNSADKSNPDEQKEIDKVIEDKPVNKEEKSHLAENNEMEQVQKKEENNDLQIEEAPCLPKGFFDDPDQELKLMNPTSKLEEQENKNIRLKEDLKIFNQFLQDELLLFEEDNNDEEDNAYSEKINDEIETMIELSNKAANLIKKSKGGITQETNMMTPLIEDEDNQTLKKKRRAMDLEQVFNESKEDKEESADVDIFDLGWKTKGG